MLRQLINLCARLYAANRLVVTAAFASLAAQACCKTRQILPQAQVITAE